MHNLQVIEQDGIRVLTSKQLAEEYGTTSDTIKVNFTRNRERFIEGKHYISLSGNNLKLFKNKVTECNLVGKTANKLYRWTEKGALLHAKSLNTDKAWEVYEYLVDFYFRAKEEKLETAQGQQASEKKAVIPVNTRTEKMPETIRTNSRTIPVYSNGCLNIENDIKMRIFVKLVHLVENLRGEVRFTTFESKSEGMMVADHDWNNLRIAIRSEMGFDKYIYNIAYELAHYFLHFDKEDTITGVRHKEYAEQADRGAKMLLVALAVE